MSSAPIGGLHSRSQLRGSQALAPHLNPSKPARSQGHPAGTVGVAAVLSQAWAADARGGGGGEFDDSGVIAFEHSDPRLLRAGCTAPRAVDRQLDLEADSGGCMFVQGRHHKGAGAAAAVAASGGAVVLGEHPSTMAGFSRRDWGKDPFYGWRTKGMDSEPPPRPVPQRPPVAARGGVSPEVAGPGAGIGSRRDTGGPRDPFAAWRDGEEDPASVARRKASADPFSSWRQTMGPQQPSQPQEAARDRLSSLPLRTQLASATAGSGRLAGGVAPSSRMQAATLMSRG